MSEELQDLSFWSHRLTAFCHSSLTLSNPFISSFQVYNLNATYSLLIKKGSKYKRDLSELWPKQPSCLYNGLGSTTQNDTWRVTAHLPSPCSLSTCWIKDESSIWGESCSDVFHMISHHFVVERKVLKAWNWPTGVLLFGIKRDFNFIV